MPEKVKQMTPTEKQAAVDGAAALCHIYQAASGGFNTTAFLDAWQAAYDAYDKARALCPTCTPPTDPPDIPPPA